MDDIRFKADSMAYFKQIKDLADSSLARLSEGQFFKSLDWDGNSPAILVKHLAGNLHSRWTDFLASDGEKPDRNRDGEFVRESADARLALMAEWEQGWRLLFDSLEALEDSDMDRLVKIRGEEHAVSTAILRQIGHYGYHVGQIVMLSRHFLVDSWESLSVPRGGSEAFNEEMREKHEF